MRVPWIRVFLGGSLAVQKIVWKFSKDDLKKRANCVKARLQFYIEYLVLWFIAPTVFKNFGGFAGKENYCSAFLLSGSTIRTQNGSLGYSYISLTYQRSCCTRSFACVSSQLPVLCVCR